MTKGPGTAARSRPSLPFRINYRHEFRNAPPPHSPPFLPSFFLSPCFAAHSQRYPLKSGVEFDYSIVTTASLIVASSEREREKRIVAVEERLKRASNQRMTVITESNDPTVS